MNENDILESCLDALRQGATLASCKEKHPELSKANLSILQAAARLSAASQQLTPDPAFKRRARHNLMQRIAADQARQTPHPRPQKTAPSLPQRWRSFLAGWPKPGLRLQPLAAAAVAVFVVLALGMGIVSAARSALPGDSLYPIKRISEQARSLRHQDDIRWQLELAQRRLDEAIILASQNHGAAMDDALTTYTAIIEEVIRLMQEPESMNSVSAPQISAILSHQMEQLTALQAQEPAHKAVISKAIAVVTQALAILHPGPLSTPALTPDLPTRSATATTIPPQSTLTATPVQRPTTMPTATRPEQQPPTATPAPPSPMPTSPPATWTPTTPALPTATWTPMPGPTMPPTSVPTHQPPTATPVPPTPTVVPPMPTATPVPPTPTTAPPMPTATPVPPTPTAAPPMPTATPVPPTPTAAPPMPSPTTAPPMPSPTTAPPAPPSLP